MTNPSECEPKWGQSGNLGDRNLAQRIARDAILYYFFGPDEKGPRGICDLLEDLEGAGGETAVRHLRLWYEGEDIESKKGAGYPRL